MKTGLSTLAQRRKDCCLDFSLKCIQHPQNIRLFPNNPENIQDVRQHETFHVNYAHNDFYKNSAIPCCQRQLNTHMREKKVLEEQKEQEKEFRRRKGG